MVTSSDRFWWGVATSAFQIEGTSSDAPRGESVWDEFCRRPGAVADGSDASVATDHVRRVEEDVALIAGLGVDAYRFSISWPRVVPGGRGPASSAGLAFYDRLVDALLASGVEPLPTLFHWDTPLELERSGGWLERDTAQRFAAYVEVVADHLGDRVGHWITINEPREVTMLGYALGTHAPGRQLLFDALPSAHHQLLGHGLAVQALRAAGARSVGIAMSHETVRSTGLSDDDRAAADLYDVLNNRLFADPVLLGRYPDGFADLMPGPVEDDLTVISTPVDWYGVNYYSPAFVGAHTGQGGDVNGITMPDELPFTVHDVHPGWTGERTDFGWPVAPEDLTELLVQMRTRYGPSLPPVVITENGCSFDDPLVDGRIQDDRRIDFLRRHLDAVEDARSLGVDVRGYVVWTLIDNFEWAEGYRQKFGLVHVDRETLDRTPRASYDWYAEHVRSSR
ncbi:GH1 family beta-glucosidase [Aeromicrobium sp. Leaf350]|uniref:GH1 family beta-glucosidase n=1 Tax=Aeromicrobium sp. Leaf350 TaxID=2876565 RepID=UPI001E5D1BFF|nr:GH1 family beta-glucosidase [Aeromicrobium sp. Leaf350]